MKSKFLQYRNSHSVDSAASITRLTKSNHMTTTTATTGLITTRNGSHNNSTRNMNSTSRNSNKRITSNNSTTNSITIKREKDANNNEEYTPSYSPIDKLKHINNNSNNNTNNNNNSEEDEIGEQFVFCKDVDIKEVADKVSQLNLKSNDMMNGEDENNDNNDESNVDSNFNITNDKVEFNDKEMNGFSEEVTGTDSDGEGENSHSPIIVVNESMSGTLGNLVENKTNLIVNYLPQNMTQEEMRELFSRLGEVESCKLVRDKVTGQSLSYGFVNYLDATVATKAIRQYNGLRLQNKIIKVSLARPSSETIKGANLYICGLPKSMSQSELEDLFSQHGKIITCRILVDSATGNSKGVAFIRFDQRLEAETAIRKLNGYIPSGGGEPITVKLANTPFNISNSGSSGGMVVCPPCSGPEFLQSHSLPRSTNCLQPPPPSPLSSVGCTNTTVTSMGEMSHVHPLPHPHPHPHHQQQPPVPPQSIHHPLNSPGPEFIQQSQPTQIPYAAGQLMCPPPPPQMHSIGTFPLAFPGMPHPSLQSIAMHSNGNQLTVSSPPNHLMNPTTTSTLQQQQSQQSQQTLQSQPQPTHPYLSLDSLAMANSAGQPPQNHPHAIIDPTTGMCCLFVCNLAPDTKEAALWQTFGPFGAVHSVILAKDNNSKCRGYGIVFMPNYQEALLALQHLNGNILDNRTLQIMFNPNPKMSPIGPFVLPSVAP